MKRFILIRDQLKTIAGFLQLGDCLSIDSEEHQQKFQRNTFRKLDWQKLSRSELRNTSLLLACSTTSEISQTLQSSVKSMQSLLIVGLAKR